MSELIKGLIRLVEMIGVVVLATGCILVPPSLISINSRAAEPVTLIGFVMAIIVVYLYTRRSQ
jgi:hypothetical protein